MATDYNKATELIRAGAGLPKDFQNWALADETGRTMAHEAAAYGHLPPDFDRWELADEDGNTVAQGAYEYRHLPNGFPFHRSLNSDGNQRCVFVGS
ncbi:MAG: hypothetical protein D6735_14530 [Acidobacteria bacterium]|nr:MAG: hypothetical protein D6735_14530 [Acidobacteriota bacterium]